MVIVSRIGKVGKDGACIPIPGHNMTPRRRVLEPVGGWFGLTRSTMEAMNGSALRTF